MKKIFEFLKWFVIIFILGPILMALIFLVLSLFDAWHSFPENWFGATRDLWQYFLNLITHPLNWYTALVAVLASGVFFRNLK